MTIEIISSRISIEYDLSLLIGCYIGRKFYNIEVSFNLLSKWAVNAGVLDYCYVDIEGGQIVETEGSYDIETYIKELSIADTEDLIKWLLKFNHIKL